MDASILLKAITEFFNQIIAEQVNNQTKALTDQITELKDRIITIKNDAAVMTEDDVKRIAAQVADEALQDHNSDYDHDEFVSDVSDAVYDVVNNMSFEVRVS